MQNSKVRYDDLYVGLQAFLDRGFTCIDSGYHEVKKDENGFYFDCSEGKHYFDGQLEFNDKDDDTLVGVYYFDINVE